MMKIKGFRISALLLLCAASVAGMALTAHAAPAAGSLIKRPDVSAVYYYASNGKRYVFPNERVFKTWYGDFLSVRTVTADELAAMPIGGNVTYRPGFRLIKITSDPKVYAVSHGGILRPIASEAVAVALFGANWAKIVDDIPDAFFVNYTIGVQIAAASDFNRNTELASSMSINGDKGFGHIQSEVPLPPTPDSVTQNPPPACTADTWYCTAWNACSPDGNQTRVCVLSVDCPNVMTPSPETTQSCAVTPACTEDSWYCTPWNACSPDGSQTRFCALSVDCPNVETPMPPVSQACTPPPGEVACTEDTWYCVPWTSCSPDHNQTRVCLLSTDCPNVVTPMPSTSQSCTP